jgi:chemotaxis protein MotB
MPAVQAPAPKKKTYTAVKLAVVGFLAAGGLGYYAFGVRDERDTSQSQLVAAITARNICQKDLTETRDKAAVLGGTIGRTEAEKEHERTARENAEKGLSEKDLKLQATQAELEAVNKQRVETEKRLKVFKDLTARFQAMIDSGRLAIVVRDGRMIVKLPAGVLFDSGKAELSKDGEMALMEVAVVLREMPDRKFMIIGHTDNVPPQKASIYKDNRELSIARSLTVTKFLVAAGIKPENLVSAGYGEHDPVKSNKSDGGRKENRRIEIVLMPNIDEMPALPAEMTPQESPPKQ